MLLRRFYDEPLAQASFLVGCQETGEAIVIDANRDLQQYIDVAHVEGLRITHVTETHIHADYLSGTRELAARTGALMLLSREGGNEWQYAFAEGEGATLLANGAQFRVGNIAFEVIHTPGHTPEHLTFLVTDTKTSDHPVGAFTGDFIFAGDVGRPDLLEKAANVANTMESSAKALFRSLRDFRSLPPYIQLWPGHGAGSACGKSLGAMPQTTLGYELVSNWAFHIDRESEFVKQVLAGQPDPPRYFAEMKRLNRDGPPLLDGFKEPTRLEGAKLAPLVQAKALVIDTRRAEKFAAGFMPGTINIPLGRSFTTYAGSLLPYDADLYLIVDDKRAGAAAQAARDLAMIGLDRVGGAFGEKDLAAWAKGGGTLAKVPQLGVQDAHDRVARNELALVDVRNRSEWDEGHAAGVPNIPWHRIAERVNDVAEGRGIALMCQTGARSVIAASLLVARGYPNVVNVTGGFAEWEKVGLPVEAPAA